MNRIALLLAAALVLGTAPPAFAKHRHHGFYGHSHGFISRGVSLRRSGGAPAAISPRGGDRAPVTGGGY